MRFLTCIVLLLNLVTQTPLLAQENSQESEGNNTAFLFNLLGIPFGVYEARFERKLDKSVGLSLIANYYDGRKVLVKRLLSYGYGFSLGVAPKFHIFGEALDHGFYLAPHVNAGYINHPKLPADERHSILIRVGASFGFVYAFSPGLAFDFSAGIERYHSIHLGKAPSDMQTEKDTGGLFRPILAASIGFAF